ncbi:nitrilase-related carbon-nitrogen hydrolase [Nocardioides jiangxiensis]|uniref:Nitrilase-related carbon-nitrogen hydrolase n=1 Tax=Nocardioides jiangxiensis TaxID=3064524 RepID=A0ABT9B0F4_9ACTN|nr:nitrilase-related carbon-nitrogen hydrolase [Nocardioides sp. WY-20]MDO7868332.1 nitrilase-related carbon-nitrogen hydrolase [Nocardioides sp. WY-20]
MAGETLTVAALQWGAALDAAANRAALAEVPAAELVVLPEAFARDFGPATEPLTPYAEEQGGPFDAAVTATADRGACTVVAGMFERVGEDDRPFNTLLVRGGATAAYRKIHLYDSFGYRESDRLRAGTWAPVVVDVAGWKVGVLTCYDLRFPELARDLVAAGAEVLVVPAAWLPGRTAEEHARKVTAWETLARARAIENVSFVVAVGQPAPRYTGHSLVLDPYGASLAEAGDGPAELLATLERSVLDEARSTNPSLANRVH